MQTAVVLENPSGFAADDSILEAGAAKLVLTSRMKALIFQHVPFETSGAIGPWLDEHGWSTQTVRFDEPAWRLPSEPADLLIVLGGPMSVEDTDRYSWLEPEMEFLRGQMQRGIPILGICLGAQLICRALGGRVVRNPQREIGWWPVERAPGEEAEALFPECFTAFHWHGEACELPPGTRLLARSAACPVQAFGHGERVLGLQFHCETTPAILRGLVEHCPDDLQSGPFVQSAEDLLATPGNRFRQLQTRLWPVLGWLLR